MNVPPPAESPRPARSLSTRLGEAAGFVLLWVTLMQPLRTLAPSLDSSWQMMLGYAHDHGLQFGRDLVPTVGPAGFLIMASPAVHHLGARLGWMLLGNAALALVFWSLGRALAGPRRFLYLAFLLLIVAPAPESMQGLALLILGFALLTPASLRGPGRPAALAGAIGFLALFKFTHLALAAAIVAAAAVHAVVRRRPLVAAAIAGGFAVAFLGGWRLLGQSWSVLPDFLRLSAEISRGYVDAMSVYEDAPLFLLGLGTVLASVVYAWFHWRGASDRPRAAAGVVMLAAAWFLNWKHGFVRADGHSLTLFIACLLPALAFPALTQESVTPAKQRLLAAVTVLALGGILAGYPAALTQSLSTFNTRLSENLSLLAELRHPRQFAAQARADFAKFAEERRLPHITELVGAASVDVLGTRQAAAMFDNFHYTPRPVFQNYYAFTPALVDLNVAFYASDRAPRYVLQQVETIDHRLPALDDARVQAMVQTHYALAAEENGWLLWARQTPPRRLALAPLASSTVDFGQPVNVPASPDGALWAQAVVTPSLLGRIRAFWYKPPQLALEVTTAGGTVTTYRLVREMAADGWLIRPHFVTQADVAGYYDGREPDAVRSFRLVLPGADRKYFSAGIRVAFSRLPPLARRPVPPPSADPRYRMFNLAPARVESPHTPGPLGLDGKEVFFIHAPGEMEFAPDAAVTRLRGAVGFAPGAYTGPQKTDGVEIVIEFIAPDGTRSVLWRRTLDPAAQAADRGLQPFQVALPGPGRVLLRNLVGAHNDPSFDWTVWADLRFE